MLGNFCDAGLILMTFEQVAECTMGKKIFEGKSAEFKKELAAFNPAHPKA